MSQFTIYRNQNVHTKNRIPFLLDVQSDLVSELGTRVVIPLTLATAFKGKVLRTLTPVVEIAGKSYIVLTPQLAGIAKNELGPPIADLSTRRDEIIAALDFLITGI
jgi:toxin CcdB